jgi:hypothetical protein
LHSSGISNWREQFYQPVGRSGQKLDLESVLRQHNRFGAAITTARKQFERPAALLLRRRHLGSGGSRLIEAVSA